MIFLQEIVFGDFSSVASTSLFSARFITPEISDALCFTPVISCFVTTAKSGLLLALCSHVYSCMLISSSCMLVKLLMLPSHWIFIVAYNVAVVVCEYNALVFSWCWCNTFQPVISCIWHGHYYPVVSARQSLSVCLWVLISLVWNCFQRAIWQKKLGNLVSDCFMSSWWNHEC